MISKPVKKKTEKKPGVGKPSSRKEVLNTMVDDINHKYGTNAIMVGFPKATKDTEEWYNVKRFSTSIPSFDIALGGGLPVGRYIEVQGAFSACKSTIVYNTIREFQKEFDMPVLLADAERTFTAEYGESLGIDSSLIYYNPSAGLEETTQMILDIMDDDSVKMAVIDSIEALVPTKEYDKNMQDTSQLGIKQKLLSEFFRKFQAKNNRLFREGKMPFTLVGINQLRDKISFMGGDFAPGGRAKDFYQSICVKLRKGDNIVENVRGKKVPVGKTIHFNVSKNKTFPAGRDGEFDIYLSKNQAGIPVGHCDKALSIIIESINFGLIQRKGAYYSLETEPDIKFQGKDKLLEYLSEHPDKIDALTDEVNRIIREGEL